MLSIGFYKPSAYPCPAPYSMNNILLTGLPRSGTTLMCFLLNKLRNSVALHEPLPLGGLQRMGDTEMIEAIHEFIEEQRTNIVNKRMAISKSSHGKVPSNPLSDEMINGQRARLITGNQIEICNVEDTSFLLYIKHPVFFTAKLELLTKNFECYASVRNPLAVILSWRSANMNISKGRVPAAESSNSRLNAILEDESDVLARQLIILDYFFESYRAFLGDRVVRYEDIVSSRGKALELVCPLGHLLDEDLTCRNQRLVKVDPEAEKIAKILTSRDSPCWSFYDKEDISSLFSD
jgi:hypothetical protein